MKQTIIEQLEVLRRVADRGIRLALQRDGAFVDLFQHLLDEIARTKGYVEKSQ